MNTPIGTAETTPATVQAQMVRRLAGYFDDDEELCIAAHAFACETTGIPNNVDPSDTDKEAAYYAAYCFYRVDTMIQVIASFSKLTA